MRNFYLIILLILPVTLFAQDFMEGGRLTGNFQVDAQYYGKDSAIGAGDVPSEKILSNSFLNLIYNHGNFEVGMRYESYLNPILGFDRDYKGNGIFYRYITYTSDDLDVTAGTFYEQFGSGMIFRAYEERQLGLDNTIDGFRVKFRPIKGIEFTGLMGKQRAFWDYGDGLLRAGDLFVDTDEIIGSITEGLDLDLGASIVSKFESDQNPTFKLPENVLAWTTRMKLTGEIFNFFAEYGFKYNDPNGTNNFNYNDGQGIIADLSLFTSGFGASFNYHAVDNMDFRSERNALGNKLNINYIPPLTKQQAYRLATVYPYASQLNGEVGIQGEINYKIPKKTVLGGRYGTSVSFNYSYVTSLDTTHTEIDTVTGNPFKYDTKFLSFGDRKFYSDLNFDISRRWTEELKTGITFIHQTVERDVLENEGALKFGQAYTDILVAEVLYKFSSTNSLRTEIQHLWYSQDLPYSDPDYTFGNWFMLLAEYTIAPSWYLSVWDEYNYFTEKEASGLEYDRSLHYPSASVTYITGPVRVMMSYGRQRGGLLCVGGVCRPVPASNGMFLSISSSF